MMPTARRKAWWRDLPKAEARSVTDLCGNSGCGHARDLHMDPATSTSPRSGPCLADTCDCQVGRDWRQACFPEAIGR